MRLGRSGGFNHLGRVFIEEADQLLGVVDIVRGIKSGLFCLLVDVNRVIGSLLTFKLESHLVEEKLKSQCSTEIPNRPDEPSLDLSGLPHVLDLCIVRIFPPAGIKRVQDYRIDQIHYTLLHINQPHYK